MSDPRDIIGRAIQVARERAGPVMKANFVHDDWVMSVEEFEAFWSTNAVAGFCTVSPEGRPHVVPIEPSLVEGCLVMSTFADAVRVRDLRDNPNAALISWASPWEVVVVYGRASIEGEGQPMLTVRLVPDRIYCIRPPSSHHASTASP